MLTMWLSSLLGFKVSSPRVQISEGPGSTKGFVTGGCVTPESWAGLQQLASGQDFGRREDIDGGVASSFQALSGREPIKWQGPK